MYKPIGIRKYGQAAIIASLDDLLLEFERDSRLLVDFDSVPFGGLMFSEKGRRLYFRCMGLVDGALGVASSDV